MHTPSGFTLLHFVEVVEAIWVIVTLLFVHTEDHRRCCACCGLTGHVGQFCRAGSRAAGADAALRSFLTIPRAFLPPSDMEGIHAHAVQLGVHCLLGEE